MLYNYRLEIYAPDKTNKVLAAYESDRPFPAIQKGDVLCPEDRSEHQGDHHYLRTLLAPGMGLVATGVQHNFWHRDATGSLIWFTSVYTREVKLTEKVLRGESDAPPKESEAPSRIDPEDSEGPY